MQWVFDLRIRSRNLLLQLLSDSAQIKTSAANGEACGNIKGASDENGAEGIGTFAVIVTLLI